MIVGALGHGGYSILTEDTHLLVDPLLTDEIMGGIAEVYPRRTISAAALAAADLLLITHYHSGHLDVPTLALLPRELPVLFPEDPTIAFVLDRMGFSNRKTLRPGQSIQIGRTKLTFTGCGLPMPYLGCIVRSGAGSCWHMGDRGDTIGHDEIARLAGLAGGIDVLICSHPSDSHDFFLHGSDGAGGDGDGYHRAWLERTLDAIAAARPACFVPGTSSFRYRGRAEWLNRYVLPMRPGEFTACARAVVPGVPGFTLLPGDAVTLADGAPQVSSAGLPFVRAEVVNDDRSPDTTRPFPDVVDVNPLGLTAEALLARAEAFVSGPFLEWCNASEGGHLHVLHDYRAIGLRAFLTVVLPGGDEATWTIDFGQQGARLGRLHEISPSAHDTLRLRIAASTLDLWSRNEIPYFVAAVDCRRGGKIHAYGSAGGRALVRALPFEDPLTVMLTSDQERLHQWLLKEIARCT
jgi:hypothetical protein